MDAKRQPWLPALKPPKGGPERLSRRLQKASHSHGNRRWPFAIVGTAATLAVAIAMLTIIRDNGGVGSEAAQEIYQAESLDRLLGRPMARTETRVLIDEAAVRLSRVDNLNPKIRIYRVN